MLARTLASPVARRRSGSAALTLGLLLIKMGSIAFWDAYLKGEVEAKAWLSRGFAGVLGEDGVFEKKLKG
jgi:hypothetical protein